MNEKLIVTKLNTAEQIHIYFANQLEKIEGKAQIIKEKLKHCRETRFSLARKTIDSLQEYKGTFINDYSKAIDRIQEVLIANLGSLSDYEEAIKLMFDYQQEMANMISIVMSSCTSNLVLTKAAIEEINRYVEISNDSYSISIETLTQLLIMKEGLEQQEKLYEEQRINSEKIVQLELAISNLRNDKPCSGRLKTKSWGRR